MTKLIAILNVVAWSGFWAFGYPALSADVTQAGQMIVAAMGAGLGVFACLWLARHSQETGHAKRSNRAMPTYDYEGTV